MLKSINKKLDEILVFLQIDKAIKETIELVDNSEKKKVTTSYTKKMPVNLALGMKYLGQTEKAVKCDFEGNVFYLPKSQVNLSGLNWGELEENETYEFIVPEWIWKQKKAEFK